MSDEYPLEPTEADLERESLDAQEPRLVKVRSWQSEDAVRLIDASEVENDWAVMNSKTGRMECRRCGSTEELPLPMLLNQAADVMFGFARRHDDCIEQKGDST